MSLLKIMCIERKEETNGGGDARGAIRRLGTNECCLFISLSLRSDLEQIIGKREEKRKNVKEERRREPIPN